MYDKIINIIKEILILNIMNVNYFLDKSNIPTSLPIVNFNQINH